MEKSLKDKFQEIVNQQLEFHKNRPENEGVLFKDASFFNPNSGEIENVGNIDRKKFQELTKKGYSLKGFKEDEEGITSMDNDPKQLQNPNLVGSSEVLTVNPYKPKDIMNPLEADEDFQKLNEINQFLASPSKKEQNTNIESDASLTVKRALSGNNGGIGGNIPSLGTDAYRKEQQAIEKLGGIESRLAEEKAKLTTNFAESQKKYDEEFAKAKKEQQTRYEQKLNDYNKAVDDFSNTSIKTPNIWENKSVGQKILLGIGLFLGSAPNSSGQNRAAQAIENYINTDMERQKLELEKKRQGLSHKQNLLTQMDDIFKNEDMALNAARQVQLNNIQNQIAQLAASTESEKIKQNAQIASAKIGQAAYDTQLKVRELMNKEAQTQMDMLNLAVKSRQAPENEFTKSLQKQTGESLAKDIQTLPNIENRLNNQKSAWEMIEKVSTGPISGARPIAWFRKLGNEDVQSLDNLFSKEGMETIKQMAESSGARSIDSDAEKRFLMKTVPGLNKDENVNKNILLASNAVAKRQKLETMLKQDHANQYGDLRNYMSPLENAKTYYNPKTGDVEFATPGDQPKDYLPLDVRLKTGRDPSSKDVDAFNFIHKNPNAKDTPVIKNFLEKKYKISLD